MSSPAAPVAPAGMVYPCGAPPAAGDAVEVAPGVLWLRMRLPFSLDHINLWAIRDGERWAIVDTGVHDCANEMAWTELLAPGGALSRGVSRVIVTHMHPDHIGMAGWLARRFDCRLWMTQLEYLTCRVLVADTGREAPPEGVAFYRRAGWSEVALADYRARFGQFGSMIHPLPESFRRIRDAECLRIGDMDWQVVVGTGHSPEHACLWCPGLGLLISGDQVLPRISSNVSVFPTEPEADPLHGWLSSIERISRTVTGDVLVLPSHNEPFRGLHARLAQLEKGHRVSLERLRAALGHRSRAIDVFPALFGRAISDLSILRLATGESLAHLNYLLHRGEVRVEESADGVAWYCGSC